MRTVGLYADGILQRGMVCLCKSHHTTLVHPFCTCAHGGLHHVRPVYPSRMDSFRQPVATLAELSVRSRRKATC
jgi:hypothetical protein